MPPARSSKPSGRPSRGRSGSAAALLQLDRLARGATRTVRVPLFDAGRDDRPATGFFLDLRVARADPGGVLRFEVSPDFGRIAPHRAVLTVLKSRHEALPPLEIIERGVPVACAFEVTLDPGTERVVFWVGTEGAACVPARLAGVLRVGGGSNPPAEETAVVAEAAADEEIDTMRLPTRKAALQAGLAAALVRAVSPRLALLGELMRAADFEAKFTLLRRLLGDGTDLRLVEAAVQDVALAEQMAAGFERVRIERLDVEDPAQACIVVFHPGAPAPTVRQCLAVSVERCCARSAPTGTWDWSRLARAAALVLARRARSELDAELLATRLEGDARRLALLEELVGWAESRRAPSAVRPPVSLRECLEFVAGRDPDRAERALYELLTYSGFVGISGEVGCGAGP